MGEAIKLPGNGDCKDWAIDKFVLEEEFRYRQSDMGLSGCSASKVSCDTLFHLIIKGQIKGDDSFPYRKLIVGLLCVAMHTRLDRSCHEFAGKACGKSIDEAPKRFPESRDISERNKFIHPEIGTGGNHTIECKCRHQLERGAGNWTETANRICSILWFSSGVS